MSGGESSVRIDSWLWASRFFKTRSLAKSAIEGGKIQVDGSKAKPSKQVSAGQRLVISKGTETFEVVVLDVSAKRGPASVAQTLYQETPESIARRAERSADRKAAHLSVMPGQRPSKKDRRDIARFKRDQDSV